MEIKDKIRVTFKGKEGQFFRPHEIIDMVLQKFPGTNKTSILPADRCYNKINKGIADQFNFHVFEALEDGSYKWLGEHFPFTGPVCWRGKKVGEWVNGKRPTIDVLK